ncbi:MAG TPA: glutamate formimidoyltransferase [Bacillota bacterium]|jgi:glutamate formiminotransferase/formiminotetrahydrofolate cyclodeaminase
MPAIVECVPNFSEGRRPEVIEAILNEIRGVPGCTLLDAAPDASHNRVVVTFIGEPPAVEEAAFRACRKATELIDMEQHQGEHPRMGATDVIPFVPLSGLEMDDCVQMSRRVGQRIAEELGIPVYLYAASAAQPGRKRLPDVRRGQYEGLKEAVTRPERKPDFGPARMHPTAGATAVGARLPLVAFNANLGTANVEKARAIARAVRESSGGLTNVQAKGIFIEETGRAQVTMNLIDYQKTPIHRALELVQREAERYGETVTDTELVGLVPLESLLRSARWYLKLKDFKSQRQITDFQFGAGNEGRLDRFVEDVASSSPAPGGGAVSATAGLLGSALFAMVARLTLTGRKYEAAHPAMRELAAHGVERMAAFPRLMAEDTEAYEVVAAAYKLPKDTDEEKAQRSVAIQAGLKGAVAAPLKTCRLCAEALADAIPLLEKGNPNAVTDVGVGIMLYETGFKGARLNVDINLGTIGDAAFVERTRSEVATLQARVDELVGAARAKIAARGLRI